MALQWKNGAAWEAIPSAALYGTYDGTMQLIWPPAIETGLDGSQAGATGKPRILIATKWMSDTGMGFWRARFTTATARSADISIEAWNPNSGAIEKFAGKLQRPTFDSVGVGGSAGATIYRGVRVEVWECVATT